MEKLHIFNPEHDLALAFGGTNYTPPPMARLLRRDLQLLPMWIGDEGDSILSQDIENDTLWAESINKQYALNYNIATIKQIHLFDKIQPWGWNKYLQRRLFLDGAKETAIPSNITIENIRQLSHRRISIDIHRLFHEYIPTLSDCTPQEMTNLNDVITFAKKHPCAYTKAPWSSSGKGIYRALDINGLDFTRWCSGIIKRQGSIMCERPLNSLMDFAMEFKCEAGKTEFIGYSIFNNDAHSSFTGGLIGSTDFLHKKISTTLEDENLLNNVKDTAIKIIDTLIATQYQGYLGIDMMIYRDLNDTIQINPCIELNLRTTMGVVSSIIGNRFLADDATGSFNVEFHKSIIHPNYKNEMEQKYPLILSNEGKIKSGVQFLTPLYPDSQYCAYIKI